MVLILLCGCGVENGGIPYKLEAPSSTSFVVARALKPVQGVPRTVRVSVEEGRVVQVTVAGPEEGEAPLQTFLLTGPDWGYPWEEADGDLLVREEDMDFDGHPDFSVTHSLRIVNSPHYCFLWDAGAGEYRQYEPLFDISSPEFDQARRLIYSWTKPLPTSAH